MIADANANTNRDENDVATESSDDESNYDEQQGKKKQKKEKVGFRDRKVNLDRFILIYFDLSM